MSNRSHTAAACPLPSTAARLETRGLVWLVASFVVCPCHLPLTLALAGLLLAGTAAGALLQSHPLAAGVLVTAVWAAGTWRGFHLLRAARRFADSQLDTRRIS
jgi:mercuric ion transport protein